MPLHPGTSNNVVSGNIRDMRAAGHPQRVAVAAAMREKDQSKPRGFAMGGAPMMGGLGSLQGLGGDIMGGFGKVLGSPMSGMLGQGGFGGGGGGGFEPRTPQVPMSPTGGAAENPMTPLMSHYAPSPAAGGSSPAPAQPSSAMYGTTMVGPTAPAMPGRAAGGPAGPAWFAKNEARSMLHTGPIASAVNGRTDHIPLRVPNGSYVLPADHISHMGQSNSIAGLAKAGRMFSTGPFGSSLPKGAHGRGAPSAPAAPRPPASTMTKPIFADGGKTHEGAAVGNDDGVDIMAAGGEFVVPPEVVRKIGEGNLEHGHKVLDAWVMKTRNDHKKTLAKLPRPAR